MNKLLAISLLILAFFFMSSSSFADSSILSCQFTDRALSDISTMTIKDNIFYINDKTEIHLDISEINCQNFGRQSRFDGNHSGYTIVLRSCTSFGVLEGRIIDNIQQAIGDITCDIISE